MQIKLFVGEDLEPAKAAADAQLRANQFLADPAIQARSITTTITDHRFDPMDRSTVVVVITVAYDELESISPAPRTLRVMERAG